MDDHGLTNAQIAVAQAFFSLSESNGFLATGGAALIAHNLSARSTQDLDIFAHSPMTSVLEPVQALIALAEARSWKPKILQENDTFCRVQLEVDDETVLVDLAIDTAPTSKSVVTVLGPTMSANDVAARKLLALFDRSAARDFVDIYRLASTLDRNALLDQAREIDLGFDMPMFVEALLSHRRYEDDEFQSVDASETKAMRTFFDEWAAELSI